MKKIQNLKNRLSLSVDKLSSARTRSPPSERKGDSDILSVPLSVDHIPFTPSSESPPSPLRPQISPPLRPQRETKRASSRSRPSSIVEDLSVASDCVERDKSLLSDKSMSDLNDLASKSSANHSFDSFSTFSKTFSESEPQSLIDEVMKEVDKISKIKSKESNSESINDNIQSKISEDACKSHPRFDLQKTSHEDIGNTKLSDDTLNTETSTSSSTSLGQEKNKTNRRPPDNTFTRISTSSTLHAESLTSGYFSDSASEDTVVTDFRERQVRAKTTSPIQMMFRKSKYEKDEETATSTSSPEEKKELPKKESIYSRLIKSTKRDSSISRASKEPIYARIKPKLKIETSFKPIEPVVSKESSTTSDLLVKPEPIYSKVKSKKPVSPSLQQGKRSPTSPMMCISSGSPSSPFTPVTPPPPVDKVPSKEPIYSSIIQKKEKTRSLPFESLYSKIKKRDTNTFPKESISPPPPPPPKSKEPIYTQPLPALPFENKNNYKKYEFLSCSGPEHTYGKVLSVKTKEISTVSPSKPSVITISNPGYAKTISPSIKDYSVFQFDTKSITKLSNDPKYDHSANTKNFEKSLPSPTLSSPTLPSPTEEIKSDMEESTTSLDLTAKETMEMSTSTLDFEDEIKMDIGSSSKLSRLVEELAIELETVVHRTGDSHGVESKREVLNRLLSTYDVPKNLRPVEEADEEDVRQVERSLLRSSSADGLRYMDDDETMETVYADVPDYSQDEFVIALDDENDPKYASLTRGMRRKPRGGESPGKVSRKSAQVYVNVVSVISALRVLINSNSTKAVTVINKMGTLARPYAQKVHTSISDNNTWIQRKLYHRSGHNGFDELRKYIKSGGEFCKELAIIMHERAELEATYAKGLHKLSAKLVKASRDSIGTISEAWQVVGAELEHEGDVHRILAASLAEDVVKPLRQVIDTQHKIRKGVEGMVDKATKNMHDWKTAEMKAKKNCFHNTRENEKVQDMVIEARLGRGKSLSDKDMIKLEKQRRKAEEAVQKSDVEYYTYCIRTERARQEWESAVYKGSNCFQTLEEERLAALKDLILKYHRTNKEAAPKLVAVAARLDEPVSLCDVEKDIQAVILAKGTGENVPEQFLPDFYSEDLNNVMNKIRRKEALEKFIKLIRIDLERERRGKQGVENLAKALQETPNFGGEESQQDVNDKLQNMKAMLAYLEASRYKVQASLDDVDCRPRCSHPLAKHIETHRDKQGLPVSILKVPPWIKGNSTDVSPMSESPMNGSPNWNDRGTADGTSVQPDSDFAFPNDSSPSVLLSVETPGDAAVPSSVPRAFMYPARYPSLILPTDEFSSQGSDADYQIAVNDMGHQQGRCQKVISAPLETRPSTTPDGRVDSGTGSVPSGEGMYFAQPLTTTGASLGRCKALYDYEANLYDELSIRTGDIINIHDKQPDGWWVGEVEGNVGIFPATYVEEID